jgi:histidine ammonia-lyase
MGKETSNMETVKIKIDGLTLADLVSVARKGARVHLTSEVGQQISNTRNLVENWVEAEETIYGVTTGFGMLSDVTISKEDTRKLQKNILMSHAAGVGDMMAEEEVRAMMLLRVKDLARGHSAIRLETLNGLIDLLNHGITPLVPEKGSVGASGDLCPLAHLSLVLIGEGEALADGKRMSGKAALTMRGLEPVILEAGEGLSLVNGTQAMTGIGGLAVFDALHLSKLIDIAASMSLEVLMGSRTEFDPRIQNVRPHPGQAAAADNMLRITRNSEIISSHQDCSRIQDAYTLRCSPQVHGASYDAIHYAAKVIETEMNSSTGNPLFFNEDGEFLLGGNFHGQPVALAMDFLGIAVSELANISERRIERLVNPMLSGLPAFLVEESGLNSGFMIAQYTAAALVSENKVLSHPASVDSIPTSANKEDHVSMGTISSRKAREIVLNTEDVVAIELLCAAQALDVFTNTKPGDGTRAAYEMVRGQVPRLVEDRVLSGDISAVKDLMKSGRILDAVEARVGKLN